MPNIVEGTGTTIFWWYDGRKPARLPLDIIEVTPSAVNRQVMDRTHLLSPLPDELNEYGGRQFGFTVLSDPGELVLRTFFDPNVTLPQRMFNFRMNYPRLPSWLKPAGLVGEGFFSTPIGTMTITVGTDLIQTLTLKLSGTIRRIPARRT